MTKEKLLLLLISNARLKVITLLTLELPTIEIKHIDHIDKIFDDLYESLQEIKE